MNRRVVVTGMGAITPIGNNVNEFFDNVQSGVCGIDFIKTFDTEAFAAKTAAQVKNFEAKSFMDAKDARRMDRFSQFAVAAAKEAVADSGLDLEKINRDRFGVIVGSGIGALDDIEKETNTLRDKGPKRVNPLFIPMTITNMAAGNIAIQFGANGICTNVVTACATGNNCIGEAFRNIKHGYADIIISGGAEASITPLGIAGFQALTALSTSKEPLRASIPFDKERDGFVMGEGAGSLVLEEYEHAKARGAKIYAELVGAAMTADAYHMTAPHPDGAGAIKAMQLALEEAGANAEDINYINPHATSTPLGDLIELNAINKIFKGNTNLDISATKSMTGHLLGAAGAAEAILSIKAIQTGIIPPTINNHHVDERIPRDINIVFNKAKEKEINYALSNAFGFGGHNATLIFKKFK